MFHGACVQIFDAFIIIASFVLDVVFLDGVTEVSEGEQAAALIMIFLLWRVLRIVNGQLICFRDSVVELLARMLGLGVEASFGIDFEDYHGLGLAHEVLAIARPVESQFGVRGNYAHGAPAPCRLSRPRIKHPLSSVVSRKILKFIQQR